MPQVYVHVRNCEFAIRHLMSANAQARGYAVPSSDQFGIAWEEEDMLQEHQTN